MLHVSGRGWIRLASTTPGMDGLPAPTKVRIHLHILRSDQLAFPHCANSFYSLHSGSVFQEEDKSENGLAEGKGAVHSLRQA